jgi:myosin I
MVSTLFFPPLVSIQLTNSGWWLCKNTQTNVQGWAPAAYVEEIIVEQRAPPPPPPPTAPARPVPAVAVNGDPPAQSGGQAQLAAALAQRTGRPGPPAPPAKRPSPAGLGRKPAPAPPPRDSAVSLSAGGPPSGGNSGRNTPNSQQGGLAGGLAEALRARQSAMSTREKEEDDDW